MVPRVARCRFVLGFLPRCWSKKLLAKLADLWGNPTAIEKALREAEPEKAEVDKARKQLERIQAELAKVKDGRDRILGFIAKGIITDDQAERQLKTINEREIGLADEGSRLQQRLSGTLSPNDRQRLVDHLGNSRRRAGSRHRDIIRAVQDPSRMTWEQKRLLVQDVFGGTMHDGKRMGVYVAPIDLDRNRKHRSWRYVVQGRIETAGVIDDSPVVTKCVTCCRARALP